MWSDNQAFLFQRCHFHRLAFRLNGQPGAPELYDTVTGQHNV